MKVSSLFLPIVLIPGLANAASPSLKERLLEIIGHDKIGVAIVYDNGTEMALDGNRRFPMMSLAKFHQAIALASELGYPAIFTDTVKIAPTDLLPGTWSPLRARYPEGVDMPLPNLLNYTLNMSDNNGADVLFNHRLSPQQVDSIVKARYGVHDFAVSATEAQMHADHSLAATNYTTPLGAARLFNNFFTADTTSAAVVVKAVMSTPTSFGKNRILAGIPEGKAMVFHKTGTGFDLPDGGVSALVDAAFVSYVRPNGTTGYYSLAVCVEDWHQHPNAGEQKIAQISEAVWNSIVESNLLSMNTSAFIAPATRRPQSSFSTVSDEESSAFFGLLGEAIIQAVVERMISGENE